MVRPDTAHAFPAFIGADQEVDLRHTRPAAAHRRMLEWQLAMVVGRGLAMGAGTEVNTFA